MARQKKSAKDGAELAPASSLNSSWLILKYSPVTLFSLRSTMSTSKGGKTLLVPTPYAVKLALIDATFRSATADTGDAPAREMFERIKSRTIRFRPPADCVVQNTFVKIRQEARDGEAGMYVPTIAYRELVFFRGDLEIAIGVGGLSETEIAAIENVAMHVNYLGKRGSFIQFTSAEMASSLSSGFSLTMDQSQNSIPLGLYGVSHFLDDFGRELCIAKDGFERISTFHENPMALEKHRILIPTLIPYRQVEATRSYTRYTSRLPEPAP